MHENTNHSDYGNWFALQTLRSKIVLLIAFFILAFGLITVIVFYENRLTVAINRKGVNVNAPATITALELIAHVRESQKNLYQYLGQPQNNTFMQVDSLWANHLEPTIQKLYELRSRLASPTDQKIIDSVRASVSAFRKAQQNTMRTYRAQLNVIRENRIQQKDSIGALYERAIIEKQAQVVANQVYEKQVEPIVNHLQRLLDNFVKGQQQVLNDNFKALESSVQLIDVSVLSISLLVAFLGIVLSYIVMTNLQKSVAKPTQLMKRLALGELPSQISETHDEFREMNQACNQLVDMIRRAGNFALEIGEGNLKSDFKPISDKDILGNSLIQMRERLKIVTEDDRRRSWATEGYALIGDVIRKHSNDIQLLCDNVLTALIEYVGAIQGGIFIYQETQKEKYLEMKACYAYGRKKFLEKKIQIHEDYAETLIGQVYLEQEKVYMTHLPAGYTQISSGIGSTTPRALLITPLKTNQRIEGIMEIVALEPLEKYQIEFIERISETIGVAITSVMANVQNIYLLRDTQYQSEAMRRQEQEMRQNLLEMQVIQEKMHFMQGELREKEANLSALINSTDESLIAIDKNYNILAINEEVKKRYRGTAQENIEVGKNVLEFLGALREEWKERYDRAFAGEKFDFIKKSALDGKNAYRHYFVAPIRNHEGEVIGASVFSRDISVEKNKEEALEEQVANLTSKLDAYEEVNNYLILDTQGFIKNISNKLSEKIGYLQQELINQHASILGDMVGKLASSPYWQGEPIEIIDKQQERIGFMAQRLRYQTTKQDNIYYILFPSQD